MSTKNFGVYTKTFGGKIYTNLHRVSPGSFFSKNFNKASFQISRQKLFKHHLVQKNWKLNTNSLYASTLFRFFLSMILHLFCASFSQYFGLEFLARDDVFKSFKGKSTMAKCKDFYLKSFRLAIVEIELVNFVVAEFYSWPNWVI